LSSAGAISRNASAAAAGFDGKCPGKMAVALKYNLKHSGQWKAKNLGA
jgi:hypothetical protein